MTAADYDAEQVKQKALRTAELAFSKHRERVSGLSPEFCYCYGNFKVAWSLLTSGAYCVHIWSLIKPQ